jgi:hypothetical protein
MPKLAEGGHKSDHPPLELLIRNESVFQKFGGDRLQTQMKQHDAVNIVISI